MNGQDRLAQQRKILSTVTRPAREHHNRHGRADVLGLDPGDFGLAMAVG
jgi:hypothetical protein